MAIVHMERHGWMRRRDMIERHDEEDIGYVSP